MTIKVALAGAGAFGIKHLDGIQKIDGVEVISLISRDLTKTQEVAQKYGIAHATTNLNDALAIKEVDAVILCTPTQMHAARKPVRQLAPFAVIERGIFQYLRGLDNVLKICYSIEVIPAGGDRHQEPATHEQAARGSRHQGLRAFVVSPRHFTVISLPSLMP